MKIKVSEATNTQLNWLVAKCEGGTFKPKRCFDCRHYEERQGVDEAIQYCHHPKMDFEDGSGALTAWASDYKTHDLCPISGLTPNPYSTDWAQGGQIIEREKIGLREPHEVKDRWYARITTDVTVFMQPGPTPLIAAMRCFVASKLGDEAEVPDELT